MKPDASTSADTTSPSAPPASAPQAAPEQEKPAPEKKLTATEQAKADRKAKREGYHSLEMRHVAALEDIADAIREASGKA